MTVSLTIIVEFIFLTVIVTVLFAALWVESGMVVTVKEYVVAFRPEIGIVKLLTSISLPSIVAVIPVAPSAVTLTSIELP